jgi:hypothetical protein
MHEDGPHHQDEEPAAQQLTRLIVAHTNHQTIYDTPLAAEALIHRHRVCQRPCECGSGTNLMIEAS